MRISNDNLKSPIGFVCQDFFAGGQTQMSSLIVYVNRFVGRGRHTISSVLRSLDLATRSGCPNDNFTYALWCAMSPTVSRAQ